MRLRIGYGRAIALACALFAGPLAWDASAQGAPRAAALGSEVGITEPSNGFVGRLNVTPEHGPAGTPLTVTGEGFQPEQELELVSRTEKERWKVTIAEYHGREFLPVAYRIATLKSDAAGRIS